MTRLPRLLPCSLFIVLFGTVAAPVRAATFPDKNLEAAVQAALRLPKPEFKDDDLAKLSVLNINGKNVKTLAAVETGKGLAELQAPKNQIARLKPVKDLPILQTLQLNDNKISVITPLAGLTNLQHL